MVRNIFIRNIVPLCLFIALTGWIEGIYTVASASALRVPDGFRITIFSDEVPNARQMALGDEGTIFVGSRRAGSVYALVDSNGDFHADKITTIARRLSMPTGVAFRDKSLYVAAINRILRYPDIESRLDAPPEAELISNTLPRASHHGWKFIRFADDGKLYVPVGVPCNICELENPVFGSILSFDIEANKWAIYAVGIRNSVGFDWHPDTGELWFSDNGRDSIGDDIPPDEINRVSSAGQHFGFPYVYGDNIPQPEFRDRKNPDYEKPALNLQAHVTPLGIHFYRGNMFPKKYRNALFVAEHGSWDRSSKVGYRVMVAIIEDDKVTSYEPFVEGWLVGQSVSGRPVALLELVDGSLLISDDHAGIIYRVSYNKSD